MSIIPVSPKGSVELVNVLGDEQLISKIAGISHDSEKGPSIEKLLKWEHFSPFEFASMTFKIKCPIFVARQLFRHRTGHYLERSLRYCEANLEMFLPNEDNVEEMLELVSKLYHDLLSKDVPKERARAVLPLGLYTEYYFQMDMRNLMHMLKMRLDESAQGETREYAHAILKHVQESFPTIGEYLEK